MLRLRVELAATALGFFLCTVAVADRVFAGACTDAGGACAAIPGTPLRPAICGPVPDPCSVTAGFCVDSCDCNKIPTQTYKCYCEAS